MPLTDVSTVTVTASFRRPDGSPASGYVTFTPSVRLVDTADEIVVREPIKADLANGDLSVALPATDDADLSPSGWTWRVEEHIQGHKRVYSILLPASPATVDLADVAPTDPVSPATAYILASSVAGLATDQEVADAVAAEAVLRAAGDVAAKARANHTGTQLASTVSDFDTAADARVVAVVVKAFVDALGVDAATLDGETVASLTTAITAAIVDASPATLDTLNELAAALGDDPNFATTVTNALALKAAIADVVLKTLFDANTFLAADSDDTPTARTVGEGLVLGRPAGGNIKALSDAELKTILEARLSATYQPLPIVAETTTTVTKSNTAAEETLLTFATPLGLAVGDRLILRLAGEIANNTGANVTYQFQLKLGATTFAASTSTFAITTSVNSRKWFIEAVIALESLTAERMSGFGIIGTNNAQGFAFAGGATAYAALIGTAAEDLNTSKNVVVTATMGTADVNASVSLKSASLERLKKAA